MYLKKLSKIVAAAAVVMMCCVSCDASEEDLTEELTEGYWKAADPADSADGGAPTDYMINFAASGQVFGYVCAVAEDGGYDACYDSSFTDFYKYAVDIANGRLCFLPDRWFDILVLNRNTLTLGADDGGNLRFYKVDARDVHVLSPDNFYELHPVQ